MWATTFAFQPWHSAVELKRYMLRFMHEFPRIQTLEGVTRTPSSFDDHIDGSKWESFTVTCQDSRFFDLMEKFSINVAGSGEEILTELLQHLKFEEDMEKIKESSNCIPCMMPYITSQFMPREIGDRPQVIPKGSTNLAFIGQYCEIPDDVVFTEEYFIRAARIAVYTLLGLDKKIEPINQYRYDVRTLFKTFITSFR